MTEGEERKQRSIEVLKKYNIPYLETLPIIEDSEHVTLRSVSEIAKRTAVLLLIAGYACDVLDNKNLSESREFFYKKFMQYNVFKCLTPKEKDFFDCEYPAKKDAISMSWCYESAYALLWTMSMTNSMYFPDKTCSEGSVSFLLAKCVSITDFTDRASMRPVKEILDECDLIYRYHWAIVDAWLHTRKFPGGLNGDVVFERHKALNWVLNYGVVGDKPAEWDDVTTDT